MGILTEQETATDLQQILALLGGSRVVRHRLQDTLDAHELLLEGLPGESLLHLVNTATMLQKPALLEKALGMSLRTFQRRKDAPSKLLNQEQSGRTWKFAEILAMATNLLGSQHEAEQWLERPAIGLDRHCPIDLLATPAGVEIVEQFLERLKYGVYV